MINSLAFDQRTSMMLQDFIDREQVDEITAVKMLVAGGCSEFHSWGVEYAVRRAAFDETKRYLQGEFDTAIAEIRARFNALVNESMTELLASKKDQ